MASEEAGGTQNGREGMVKRQLGLLASASTCYVRRTLGSDLVRRHWPPELVDDPLDEADNGSWGIVYDDELSPPWKLSVLLSNVLCKKNAIKSAVPLLMLSRLLWSPGADVASVLR